MTTMQAVAAASRPASSKGPRLMPDMPRARDARVDVLRGLALFMIFVDHIPSDVLNVATLHNFGFCDAAEIFVTLAGFSSMMAYGSKFERDGIRRSLRRIGARCLRIYVAHVGLLLLTLFVVWHWTQHYGMPALAVAPLLEEGLEGLLHGLTLRALPGYLDILPLYIVLLAAFPLIYLVMRRHIGLALGLSVALWGAANWFPHLNLPNEIDGKGWYFNPFTWQLLFTIGAALAVVAARGGGMLPRWPWLAALCWVYLGFAFLQGASWADWHMPSLRLFDMSTPDKSSLSPLRTLDILALLYLFMSSPAITVLVRHRLARVVAICGRHSLEVFVIGCACALFGRLMFRTYGGGLWMQLGINALGIGAMVTIALLLEHSRERSNAHRASQAASIKKEQFRQDGLRVYRT